MTSSLTPAERARKLHAVVLRALAPMGTQSGIAAAMGVSESVVSKLKTEQLETFCIFLAHAGLKIVPAEFRCVDPRRVNAVGVLLDTLLTNAQADGLRTTADLIFGDMELE